MSIQQEFIDTGSEVLNRMLCGESAAMEYNNLTGGIPKGSTALIRGEPGSGKTTLAMQILSSYLNKSSNGFPKVFFSFEEEPQDLFGEDGRFRSYGYFGKLQYQEVETSLHPTAATAPQSEDQPQESASDNIQPFNIQSLVDGTTPQLYCLSGPDFINLVNVLVAPTTKGETQDLKMQVTKKLKEYIKAASPRNLPSLFISLLCDFYFLYENSYPPNYNVIKDSTVISSCRLISCYRQAFSFKSVIFIIVISSTISRSFL